MNAPKRAFRRARTCVRCLRACVCVCVCQKRAQVHAWTHDGARVAARGPVLRSARERMPEETLTTPPTRLHLGEVASNTRTSLRTV
eukprot:1492367-Alexandrium_andersonii.AAC.1